MIRAFGSEFTSGIRPQLLYFVGVHLESARARLDRLDVTLSNQARQRLKLIFVYQISLYHILQSLRLVSFCSMRFEEGTSSPLLFQITPAAKSTRRFPTSSSTNLGGQKGARGAFHLSLMLTQQKVLSLPNPKDANCDVLPSRHTLSHSIADDFCHVGMAHKTIVKPISETIRQVSDTQK